MAGLPVSPVNASPHTSRCVTHDSGPEWFATSSPYWTCTNYLLPALLAHRTCTSKIAPMLGAQKKAPTSGAFNSSALRRNNGDYFADINATVVSSMRFEKPHSLSYHDDTLTRRPETLVSVESKLLEAGLWLKSIDTSGSV